MTDIKETAKKLAHLHQDYRSLPNVSMKDAESFLDIALGLVFPQLSQEKDSGETSIQKRLKESERLLADFIERMGEEEWKGKTADILSTFFSDLPGIAEAARLDAEALMAGDPASRSIHEVILTYPGCHAVATYRIAHCFYKMNMPLFPRLLSEFSHRLTGIDIHPGAQIGKSFFVDHGTSVVVGETAVIGDNVKLYQGVTLGALSVDSKYKGKKRHPTIEDNVVIYSGATILGGDTVIGHDSIIGGNVWLTHSILPYSRVMYKSSDEAKSGLDWNI